MDRENKFKFISHSVAETEEFAVWLAPYLPSNTVLALIGPLGMGKTAFSRGLCLGLGGRDNVSSPTFTIMMEHPLQDNRYFYHFDAYRVNKVMDWQELGLTDYFDGGGICVIEWADLIKKILPKRTIEIHLSPYKNQDNWRIIEIPLTKASEFLEPLLKEKQIEYEERDQKIQLEEEEKEKAKLKLLEAEERENEEC